MDSNKSSRWEKVGVAAAEAYSALPMRDQTDLSPTKHVDSAAATELYERFIRERETNPSRAFATSVRARMEREDDLAIDAGLPPSFGGSRSSLCYSPGERRAPELTAVPHCTTSHPPVTPPPQKRDRPLLPSSYHPMGSGPANHDLAVAGTVVRKISHATEVIELFDRSIREEETDPSIGVLAKMVHKDFLAMEVGLRPPFAGPHYKRRHLPTQLWEAALLITNLLWRRLEGVSPVMRARMSSSRGRCLSPLRPRLRKILSSPCQVLRVSLIAPSGKIVIQ